MSLKDVTIAITSFCRWGYLKACLGSLRGLPEARAVVVDDSFDDRCALIAGPECIRITPDSGLTCKRNAAVAATKTPYWFCGSDDFNFSTPGFREGLERAADLLEAHPEIDLVGGRVNNNPYESNLEHDAGANVMRERRIVPDGQPWQRCDLVVNAFLARTKTLREVPWDEEVRPIGGEHGLFFWELKKAGKSVVWMPGFNINTLSLGHGPEMQDPRYNSFRRRCFSTGHATMLRKLGIKDWIGA